MLNRCRLASVAHVGNVAHFCVLCRAIHASAVGVRRAASALTNDEDGRVALESAAALRNAALSEDGAWSVGMLRFNNEDGRLVLDFPSAFNETGLAPPRRGVARNATDALWLSEEYEMVAIDAATQGGELPASAAPRTAQARGAHPKPPASA